MKKFLLTIILLITAVSFAAGAEDIKLPAKKIDLQQCVETAYANNPELASLGYRAESKESSVRLARAYSRPIFSLSETYSRTNNPVMSFMANLNQESISPADMAPSVLNSPDPIDNFNTKFSLQAPIYNGRQVSNGIKMAQLDRGIASYDITRKKQEVRFKVVEAYYNTLLAAEHLNVTEDAYKTAEAHVKMAQSHLDAGTVVRSDLLSAQVRFAQIDEMRLSARNNLKLAQANLLFTMGVNQDENIEIKNMKVAPETMEKDLPTLIEMSHANRAELQKMQSYAQLQELMADSDTASKRPSLNLMAEYNLDNGDILDNNGESWMAGLNVSINIFDGGRSRHAEKRDRFKALETSGQAETLRNGIELQVRQAFLNVDTASQKIGVTEKAVAQAEEALRIVENRYENGLTTIIEVLKSETNLTETKMRNIAAVYGYAVELEKLWYVTGVN